MKNETFEEDLQEELKNPQFAVEYIKEALADPSNGEGDKYGFLIRAISDVAKAYGIKKIAENAELAKSTVHSILKVNSNPTLKNVEKLLEAIGLKITVEVMNNIEAEERPACPLDVAQYILSNSTNSKYKTAMWLQKMVYYAQAMFLINFKKPLFEEPIEAWSNGPVVRKLFNAHKGQKFVGNIEGALTSRLSQTQKNCLDWTIDKYGSATGEVLSELTHSELPWIQARDRVPPEQRSTNEISQDVMLHFYSTRPASYYD